MNGTPINTIYTIREDLVERVLNRDDEVKGRTVFSCQKVERVIEHENDKCSFLHMAEEVRHISKLVSFRLG